MNIHHREPLAISIREYLAHTRALGKRLEKNGPMFHLLDRFLIEQGVGEISQIDPAHLEGFLNTRPKRSARSYNELLGMVRRFFDWLVRQAKLMRSPLQGSPRRAPRPAHQFSPALLKFGVS